MNIQELTNDSKAILLLSGRFGGRKSNDRYRPLAINEYNKIADWLRNNGMRPGDLLSSSGKAYFMDSQDLNLDLSRIKALLKRGTALALAIEKWLNRGLWVVTRSDENYPKSLRERLQQLAPPILFGVGNISLLSEGGLAVVGSRKIDNRAREFTSKVANACARDNVQIISGGARGIDQEAMLAALAAGGTAVGVLADNLLKASVLGKYRSALRGKRLVLISPYNPEAPFNVGNAMGRNKFIYALADYGLVVSTSYNNGGTWSGATEELRREKGIPIFVRTEEPIPSGNRELLKKGAIPFPPKPWKQPMRALLASTVSAIPDLTQLRLTERTREVLKVSELKQEYSTEPIVTVYDSVLPVIIRHLKTPQTRDELAKELDVNKTQLDAWLKRAIKEARIIKKGRPVRYYPAPLPQQELPFGISSE